MPLTRPDYRRDGGGEARKPFFFEKKKQKTFAPARCPPGAYCRSDAKPNGKKFFGSFFSKKKEQLLVPGARA